GPIICSLAGSAVPGGRPPRRADRAPGAGRCAGHLLAKAPADFPWDWGIRLPTTPGVNAAPSRRAAALFSWNGAPPPLKRLKFRLGGRPRTAPRGAAARILAARSASGSRPGGRRSPPMDAPDPPSDELLRRARAGDEDACGRLLEAYRGYLTILARVELGR